MQYYPSHHRKVKRGTCVIAPVTARGECWSAFALFRVPRWTVIMSVMVAMLLPFVAVPVAVSVPLMVPVPSRRYHDHGCRRDHNGRRYADIDANPDVGGIRSS